MSNRDCDNFWIGAGLFFSILLVVSNIFGKGCYQTQQSNFEKYLEAKYGYEADAEAGE